ncbi:MAG: ATP-dependent Clp protease ATP-binding subunit [Patescibacteria group bacterium]
MIRLAGTQVAALAASRAMRARPTTSILRVAIALVIALSVLYASGYVLGIIAGESFLVGLSFVLIGIGILYAMLELYSIAILRTVAPAVPLANQVTGEHWTTTVNLADYLSFELADVLLQASVGEAFNTEQLFVGLIRQPSAQAILARAGLVGEIPPGQQAPALVEPTLDVNTLLSYAAVAAVASKSPLIEVSHLLTALAEHYQAFADVLFAHHVEPDDLVQAIAWFQRNESLREKHWFWERGSVGSYGIGRDWAAGYTPTLSAYAIDVSKYLGDPALVSRTISRHDVVERIVTALSAERKANVLLVGAPGIGKKTMVNGVAAQIASGQVPRSLADKHVMQLDVNVLLAGSTGQGETESRLLNVLQDAQRAGNIVLFIDNIHTLLAAEEGTVGSINAAAMLLPALGSGALQIIATTTPQDFHATVARQGAVAESFNRIDIEEPTPEETMTILQTTALHLEHRSGVFISMPVIRAVVRDADRYLHQEPRPENAISLLEAVATAAANRGEYLVTVDGVDAVASQAANVPVGEVGATEKDKLLQLEDELHKRVVGQDEAVSAVAQALRRARSGLSGAKRPIGSFLFLGPTGVGKTETARALAAAYYGSEDAMLRFDMSEYQSPASLGQLIGSATEAQAGGSGQLTSQVRDKPFSLILLDELEKAHPDVLNIFLQILDDGHVTDGLGQQIDFTNVIIIATSNAGSEFIRQQVQVGKTSEQFQGELLNQLQIQGTFRPEFINRFDAVIAFHPLSAEQLAVIIDLQLTDLNKRLAEEQVTVALTQAAVAELAKRGYQPEFGARALKRVMQVAIENVIANRLLAGTAQRGQTITLDVADLAQ